MSPVQGVWAVGQVAQLHNILSYKLPYSQTCSRPEELIPLPTGLICRKRKHLKRSCQPAFKIQQAIGPHGDLRIVKRGKRQWYGHVSRSSDLVRTISQSTVKRGRRHGRQKKRLRRQHQGMDRPGVRQVPEGSGEQRKIEETGGEIICGAPTILAVKG